MITFNDLGYMGRLGNQMFQYAALLGIRAATGYDIGIPLKNADIKEDGCFDKSTGSWIPYRLDLIDCFDIDIQDSSTHSAQYTYIEHQHNFDGTIFQIKDNTNVSGYFQTEKYFINTREQIRKSYTFKSSITQAANSVRSAMDNTVGVHFRRGDYTGDTQNFPPLSLDYYQEAINLFNDSNYTFLIFSDDVKWCKEIFAETENIEYIESNNQFIDDDTMYS